jgi:hypothetical protein
VPPFSTPLPSPLHPTPRFPLSTLPKQAGARATHPHLHLPSSVNLPLFHSHPPNINFFKPSSRRHFLLGVKIFLVTTSSRQRLLLGVDICSAHICSASTPSRRHRHPTNPIRRLPPSTYLGKIGFFHSHTTNINSFIVVISASLSARRRRRHLSIDV